MDTDNQLIGAKIQYYFIKTYLVIEKSVFMVVYCWCFYFFLYYKHPNYTYLIYVLFRWKLAFCE